MKKLFFATFILSVSFTAQADDCFCLYDGGPMPKQFCQGVCYPIEEVIETSGDCNCKMNTVEIDGKIYSTYGHSCGGGDGCSAVFDTILDSFHEKYPDVPEEFYFPKKENWDSEEWWQTATIEDLKNEILKTCIKVYNTPILTSDGDEYENTTIYDKIQQLFKD